MLCFLFLYRITSLNTTMPVIELLIQAVLRILSL